MQPHAEHQQHHANFGQLSCQRGIGDETRREWPDQDTGERITHQRGQPQANGDETENQRQPQCGGNRGDQVDTVRQGEKSADVPSRGGWLRVYRMRCAQFGHCALACAA